MADNHCLFVKITRSHCLRSRTSILSSTQERGCLELDASSLKWLGRGWSVAILIFMIQSMPQGYKIRTIGFPTKSMTGSLGLQLVIENL